MRTAPNTIETASSPSSGQRDPRAVGEALSPDDLARVLAALSNPLRIRILQHLLHDERCVSDFVSALDEDQPKISQHLRLLREAGLIQCRVDGRRRCYSARRPALLRSIFRDAATLAVERSQDTDACDDP